MASVGEVVFALERFEWADDRLEVVGRWDGLRGRRMGRPALTVVDGEGRRRRLHALPGGQLAGEHPWRASFAWDGNGDTVERAELELGRRLVVELPPPRRPRRRAGRTASLPTPAITALEGELASARRELIGARREVTQLSGELTELSGELTQVRADLATTARERDDLRIDLAATVRERDDVRAELAAAAREGDDLRAQVAATARERDDLRAGVAQADEGRRALEVDLASERDRAGEARAEAARAGEARAAADRDLGEERAAAARLREELAERRDAAAAAPAGRVPTSAPRHAAQRGPHHNGPHRIAAQPRSVGELWGARVAAAVLAGLLLLALMLVVIALF